MPKCNSVKAASSMEFCLGGSKLAFHLVLSVGDVVDHHYCSKYALSIITTHLQQSSLMS